MLGIVILITVALGLCGMDELLLGASNCQASSTGAAAHNNTNRPVPRTRGCELNSDQSYRIITRYARDVALEGMNLERWNAGMFFPKFTLQIRINE